MTLSQIVDSLPLQVYVRRGELVIHFSSPTDLVTKLSETTAVLSDLDRQGDAKPDRGRRASTRASGPARAEGEAEPGAEGDPAG